MNFIIGTPIFQKESRFERKIDFFHKSFFNKASVTLIKNLQTLFAYMIKSDKKYVDPSKVLNSIVDDEGFN